MITSGRFDDGPFRGLPLQSASTDYLDFVNRSYPLPVWETRAIDAELQRRKEQFPGLCPVCGHYSYSARNNRFVVGVNRKGRR